MSSGTPAPHSLMQDTERSSSKCLCDGECQCTIEALRDRCMQALLLASLADVSDERLRFIPRESILQEISPEFTLKALQRVANNNDSIAALLQQATNRIIPRITPDVCHCMKPLCTGSRVIFASLLFSGLHSMLLDFIREAQPEKCDSSLWELDVNGAIFGDRDPIFQQVRQMHMQNSLLFHWIYQLRALCLTAEEGDGEIKQLGLKDGLDNRTRLPWTSIEDAARPSSSASNDAPNGPQRIDMQSSKVQKVCIHRSHHKLDDLSDVFALKTFTDDFGPEISRSDFKKELKANRSIPRNERIIPLLLAFEHRGNLCLLFPWTELGDLKAIWKEHSSPRHDGPTGQQVSHAELHSSQWILRECLGIASAVAYIHDLGPHCLLHADIKAENILGFLDRGSVILKLADFGYSKVVGSASAEVAVKGMAHTKTYRAPEYDIQKTVTTKFDVWSLGCLFLDFVTWDLMGYNEIIEFQQRRLDEEKDLGVNHDNMVEDTFFKRVAGPSSPPSRSRFQSAYRWITLRKDSRNSLSKNRKLANRNPAQSSRM
ncbi:protein kinase domain-containing protein [Apiospora marii]|uniref:Protein kinase domain-containing protein n=1 Tax=Apiospora marii TaxID=335849 RepID=A0ABR1SRL2_9PEZI